MQKLIVTTSLAMIASGVVAQNPLSNFLNQGVTFTTRCGANTVSAALFTRIDKEAYAGWGVDPANPGMRAFTGLHFFLQDQDLATQDPYSLTAYTESTASNVPDTSTALATTATFMLPLGTGVGAYNVTANFATAVLAPSTGDVFVAVDLPTPWNATITDGLSVWATSSAIASALRDEPGFAAPTTVPGNTYSGVWEYTVTTLLNGATRQCWVEPITTSSTGIASALHYADPVHANANTTPGTTCFMSAQFPDSRNPPRTLGRADDIGMTFNQSAIVDGTLVLFLVDIAPSFGPELPLSSFIPGSVGVVCLNLAGATLVNFGFTLSGSASNVMVIPAAARGSIAGLPIIHQALAFDVTTGTARSGPCSKQVL